jgi:hypothetical protein
MFAPLTAANTPQEMAVKTVQNSPEIHHML